MRARWNQAPDIAAVEPMRDAVVQPHAAHLRRERNHWNSCGKEIIGIAPAIAVGRGSTSSKTGAAHTLDADSDSALGLG